jgi:hypothetical protein
VNYELALESMMEDSFGRILIRPAISDEGAQSRDSADRAADKTETEDEKRAHCRAAVATSNANRISNLATISPDNSPIDREGVPSTPRDANNSELEGATVQAPPLATERASSNGCLPAPSSNFQSGFSGLNELGRDLPPDNSEEAFQGVSLPPFFFSCRISQPATADFDNQQRSEGKRYEHPSGTDNWTSTNERVH